MSRLNWNRNNENSRLKGATESVTGEMSAAAIAEVAGAPKRRGPSKAELRRQAEEAVADFANSAPKRPQANACFVCHRPRFIRCGHPACPNT